MVSKREKGYLNYLNPRFRRKYVKLKEKFGFIDEEYSIESFESNNCIFIHIPKTGGVSVSKTLFGNLGCGHCDVEDYHFLFGREKYNSMFTFSFVRNPFTRTASAYNFLKMGGVNKQDKEWSNRYLKEYIDINDFVVNGLPKKEIREWIHFKSQVSFLKKSEKLEVDFVGKLENINEDFKQIRKKLGIRNDLRHINKTGKSDYKGIYNSKSKKVIKEIYKKDFEILGYE